MKSIPLALILFRAALAPALPALALAFGDAARPWLAALLVAGLLSDVLDGIVARAAGVSTVALRRLDSRVDLFFWLGALAAAAILDGPALRTVAPGVAAVLALEAACQAASFARFRRAPCTHAFLSKLWGLFLGAGFVALFATGRPGARRARDRPAAAVVAERRPQRLARPPPPPRPPHPPPPSPQRLNRPPPLQTTEHTASRKQP